MYNYCRAEQAAESELLEYLITVSKMMKLRKRKEHKYACIEDFILSNGQFFSEINRHDKKEAGPIKRCFENAGKRFMEAQLINNELYYIEGYALHSVLPVIHAWIVDKNYRVIETTWPSNGVAYFGVKIPWRYFSNIISKKETWGVVDNIEMGFPLITGDHEWDAICGTKNWLKL